LGSLPIDKELRIQSDEGRPACIDNPTGDIAKNYFKIANNIITASE
jgi:MinD-like ATPase involved in chromosome partitioning or flagellar assembly